MSTTEIRIVFLGTSEFGIPVLEALQRAGHTIGGVITAPDKPAGRSYKTRVSPVKQWAEQQHIVVLQPTNMCDPAFLEELRTMRPKIFIMAAYGTIVPKCVLEIPTEGTINIHPSLLPKYRGASPIQTALLSGDTETGVTFILADELMDHGPVVAQERLAIETTDTNETLHRRASDLAANMMIKYLPQLLENGMHTVEQDHTHATFTKEIRRDDGKIDWTKDAISLERLVRAFYPWPGAFTFLPDNKRLKLLRVTLDTAASGESGIVFDAPRTLGVFCKSGGLLLAHVQVEGKEPIDGTSFRNGHKELIQQKLR